MNKIEVIEDELTAEAHDAPLKPKRGRGRPPGAKNKLSAPKEEVQEVVAVACRACGSTDTKVIYSNTQDYGHEHEGRMYEQIVNRKHLCKCGTVTWAKLHR